jgi:aminoglycoside phosphotransferase (APT) family kinase protein
MPEAVESRAIANELLARMRVQPGCREAAYAEPPEAIAGGYDTAIFSFRLAGAAAPWNVPLILRLFRPASAEQPRLEAAIQNAVADLDYPCPRVLLSGGEDRISGRPFIIMERTAGKPLIAYITSPSRLTLRASPTMALAHTRLHSLDAAAFRARLLDNGLSEGDVTNLEIDAEFARVEEAVERKQLDALDGALKWLRAHHPAPRQEVICHGDFHPMNVMMDSSGSYSLIDWTLTRLGEPEYDIARTVVLWRRAPIDRAVVDGALRLFIGTARRALLWRYLRQYQRRRSIDAERLRYYEAFVALHVIVATLDGTNTTLWRADDVLDGLAQHIEDCTGVRIGPLRSAMSSQ